MTSSSVPSRWLVPALTVATFVNFLGTLALGPFLPEVAEELRTSIAAVGQVPALVMLLAALLGLVIGPLADHYGYRRTLLVGMASVAVATAATGLAPTYQLLITVAVIGAVGRAAVQPTSQATVAAQFPDEGLRRYAMSRVGMGSAGAAVIGIPLLTFVAGFGSWRLAFFTLAGLGLVALLVLGRVLPPDARAAPGRYRVRDVLASYLPLLRHRATLSLIVATLLGTTGVWIVWSYLAAFLLQRHGFTTQEVGWAYLATGASVILGNVVAGGRLGAYPRPVMIASRAGSGVMFACALLLPVSGIAVAGLIALAMVAHGAFSVTNALVLTVETPAGRATTMTLNSSAISLGTALGGAVGGLALALGSYPALGVCAPIFSLAAAGLIWWSRPRTEPEPVAAT